MIGGKRRVIIGRFCFPPDYRVRLPSPRDWTRDTPLFLAAPPAASLSIHAHEREQEGRGGLSHRKAWVLDVCAQVPHPPKLPL
jgi:hypothetical protein